MPPLPRSHSTDDEGLAALCALGILTGAELRAFEGHLAACERCREIVAQDAETIARLSLASSEMEPSSGFKERLLRRAVEELGGA